MCTGSIHLQAWWRMVKGIAGRPVMILLTVREGSSAMIPVAQRFAALAPLAPTMLRVW
jgi:hypothetical protein